MNFEDKRGTSNDDVSMCIVFFCSKLGENFRQVDKEAGFCTLRGRLTRRFRNRPETRVSVILTTPQRSQLSLRTDVYDDDDDIMMAMVLTTVGVEDDGDADDDVGEDVDVDDDVGGVDVDDDVDVEDDVDGAVDDNVDLGTKAIAS